MGAFLNEVANFISDKEMVLPGDKIIVGLSGGADSVCLLMTLHMLSEKLGLQEGDLMAVHVNHMIRGEEAEGDQLFAKELCDKLGIKFKVFHKDITAYADELKISVEEAGRKFRYECFAKVSAEYGFDKIAVAHNKNDLAETVIFNMLRGSGLNGMSGIAPVRDNIIRPLLNVTRESIEEFLESINQTYRNDSTNASLDYQRNKIRHNIIPAMCEINFRAVEHICHMAEEAKSSYQFIHGKALEEYEGSITEESANRTVILEISQLYKCDSVLQEHLIHEALGDVAGRKKDINRKHVVAVAGLIYQETGKILHLPYGIRATRNYDKLVVTNKEESKEDLSIEYSFEIKESGVYKIPGQGNLNISFLVNSDDLEVSKKIYTKMADYDKIKDGLCIRTPQEGDYIVIDSVGNTKKLSRVFIDNKIDREKRGSWPVVASGNEVIWVIGLRYSEAYKIDQNTTKIIYMEYLSEGDM